MADVCVVGIGDMGSGLAKNLLAAKFDVSGYDLKPDRMDDFVAMGGKGASSSACLLYTSPSPRDKRQSRMPSSA